MEFFKKNGTKGRLFEMMERVNKVTLTEAQKQDAINEALSRDELAKIAAAKGSLKGVDVKAHKYGAGKPKPPGFEHQPKNYDYHGAEMDHLNQQDLDAEQSTSLNEVKDQKPTE